MEIKLQCGDTIAIPDGCKATIKDGVIIFEKEEDKEFKDGDILIDDRKLSEFPCKIIMIYKGAKSEEGSYECYIFRNLMGSLVIDERCCGSEFVKIRLATEEEKAELFDKMKEQDLRWNAEEKRVEKLLWRADVGVKYYFVDSLLDVLYIKECRSNLCNKHYSASNYFRTEEQAEEAAKRIKEVLRNYHEEIKE